MFVSAVPLAKNDTSSSAADLSSVLTAPQAERLMLIRAQQLEDIIHQIGLLSSNFIELKGLMTLSPVREFEIPRFVKRYEELEAELANLSSATLRLEPAEQKRRERKLKLERAEMKAREGKYADAIDDLQWVYFDEPDTTKCRAIMRVIGFLYEKKADLNIAYNAYQEALTLATKHRHDRPAITSSGYQQILKAPSSMRIHIDEGNYLICGLITITLAKMGNLELALNAAQDLVNQLKALLFRFNSACSDDLKKLNTEFLAVLNTFFAVIQLMNDYKTGIIAYETAEKLSAIEKYSEALEYYKEAIERQPENAKWYLSRGLCNSKLGRFIEALDDFARMSRLNPHDALPYYHLGLTSIALGQYKDAVSYAEIAVAKGRDKLPDAKTLLEQAKIYVIAEEIAQREIAKALAGVASQTLSEAERAELALKLASLKADSQRSDADLSNINSRYAELFSLANASNCLAYFIDRGDFYFNNACRETNDTRRNALVQNALNDYKRVLGQNPFAKGIAEKIDELRRIQLLPTASTTSVTVFQRVSAGAGDQAAEFHL